LLSFSGGASQQIVAGLYPTGGTSQFGVFGAQTGAGQYDTFSYRGYLPLYSGDGIGILNFTGTWHFTAAGYRYPQGFTF
jgi:hypothetical protein